MVVCILFTYTKPFTVEKKADVLLWCHSLQPLNRRKTLKFQANINSGFVGLLFLDLLVKTSNSDMSHDIQADISRMLTCSDDTDSEKAASTTKKQHESPDLCHHL